MNNYEVIGAIGEGAYGIVLKCQHKISKEIVAIKKFKDKDTDDPGIKKVIQREIKALKNLKHSNLVTMKEAFKVNGRLYLCFEFCEKSLLDIMNLYGQKGVPMQMFKSISYQIIKAISFLHSMNYLHRDIKPENVLLNEGKVKICDFGFCRHVRQPGDFLTDYVATRWYRSPELLITPQYHKAVDSWAIGCVMMEMLTGEPLLPGDDLIDQLHRIHQVLGAFPSTLYKHMALNKSLSSIDFSKFFEIPLNFNPNKLSNLIKEKSKKDDLIALLYGLLEIDPDKRLTVEDALNSRFFVDLHKPKNTETQTPRN